LLLPIVAAAQSIPANSPGSEASRFSATRVAEGPATASWRQNPLWDQAEVVRDFTQSEPLEGVPSSEETQVRLLYDDQALYVGVWLFDSDPGGIIIGERRRDANLSRADAFLLVFDTFQDQQNGFVFATTPGGIQHDGQVVSEGRGGGGGGRQQGGAGGGFNINWDGRWSVVTETDDQGWYAFFRIPFSTLRYAPDSEQRWGINFARFIGRKNEQAFWSPVPRQYNLYRLSNAGIVDGLNPPGQRAITVTPYALGSIQRIPALDESTRYPFEVGGDAKIGITRSLTLDLTINTDFAQVEVDEQQVDLTRFSLFFPEKRPFFLENAGRFSVGTSTAAQIFFSRRIGISSSGAPVNIDWGNRLSGRVAGLDVGLLHIRTEGLEGVQPANRYSVARVARELPNRSGVGFIVTDRSAVQTSRDWGRSFAVDGNLGIGESVNLAAVVGTIDSPDRPESRTTVNLLGELRTGEWRVTGFFDRVGANFSPEVGFVRRPNIQHIGGTFWRFVRVPSVSWLREVRPHIGYDVRHDLQGFKETEIRHIHSPIVWESGAQISPYVDWVYEGLSRPERIGGEVEVPAGVYRGVQYHVQANTSTQRPIVLRTGLDWGDFFSGTRKSGSARMDFQFGGMFAGQVGYEVNQVDLAEGSFDANLLRGRLGVSFTPNLFVQALVQHSSQSGDWSGNFRLGWIDSAGAGLFLVFNERHAEDLTEPVERSFVVKYSRQFDVSGLGLRRGL